MNELTKRKPAEIDNLKDLQRYVLIGREELTAVRAAIRAIDRVDLGEAVYQEKLREAQDLAEVVLDAEVRVGELSSQIPTVPGKRTDLPKDNTVPKSKKEIIEEAGFSKKQIQRFEVLAKNPVAVEQAKAEARKSGTIVTRESVLQKVKKPYVTNNSGEAEWYTPVCYIESARRVLGSIDIDPASCDAANKTVQANRFYTATDDGLKRQWTGNVWLNPPYAQVAKFVDKLCGSSEIVQAIVLVNNSTETEWFRKLIAHASAVVFHTKRMRFVTPERETSAAMQGQAFVYIGDNPQNFLNEFEKYGWGCIPSENSRFQP